MTRTDTDEINQPRIARDNQQLKTAPIARKARVSTAINKESLAHLRRFLELLFKPVKRKAKETS